MNGFQKLRKDLQRARAGGIVRRYFVIEAFSGALTTQAVVMGAYFAGVEQAGVILTAALGASVAMGVSGAVGAYMTERAERQRSMKELEHALFASLHDTVIESASKTATVVITIVEALSPVSVSLICLSPLILSLVGVTTLAVAVAEAFLIALLMLFGLGVFLGSVSKTNIWLNGSVAVIVGVLVLLFVYLISAR